MVDNVDLSSTPATLLRQSIRDKAFKSAKKTNAATWLARGELDKEEYVRLLMMLWHVYHELERAFAQHSLRMALQSFSACAASIAHDISYLLQIPETAWQSHPAYKTFLSSLPPALSAYTNRLQVLADVDQPFLLLVHAFVRHLGDVRGGLILRDKLSKVYSIDDAGGRRELEFPINRGSGLATDIVQLERWYEDQLNTTIGNDRELKALIVQEGIRAFELNCTLFTALRSPTGTQSKSVRIEPSLPLLGNPISDSGDEDDEDDDDEVISSPTAISKHTRPELNTESEGGMVSLASVLALLFAICIGQLLVVLGGLTGTRGYEKLQALERWSRSIWESFTSS